MKTVFLCDLVPDPIAIQEYERYHQEVWPEVKAHLRNIGVEHCSIFRFENRLVMVIEASKEVMTHASVSGRVAEWEQLMSRYQVPLSAEKWTRATNIFEL